MVRQDAKEDDGSVVAHDRSTTRDDQTDGLQGDADDNAVRREGHEGMTSDTGGGPISDAGTSDREEGSAAGAPTSIRPREIALTLAEWNAIPYDDTDGTPRPVPEGLPPGARSIYDYLSVLEKVAPDLHDIETHLLMDRWTMRDVAASRDVAPSTVTRWRVEAHKVYRKWKTDMAGQGLPPNVLAREVYLLWRQGTSPASITTRLNMPAGEVRRMIKTFEKNDSTWPAEDISTQPQPPMPLQPQDEYAAVIGAAVRAHDAAVAAEENACADIGVKLRKRTREVPLSSALLGILPDDGGEDDGADDDDPDRYSHRGKGTTNYDYLYYLEQVDHIMVPIETRIRVDGETADAVALDLHWEPSTLSHRRNRAAARVKQWLQQSSFNRERAICQQSYLLWQQGLDARDIARHLNYPTPEVRDILGYMKRRYSHAMPRYKSGQTGAQENPLAAQEQARLNTARRQRGPYRKGEQTKERVYRAIVDLMTLSNEPPSKRKIQAEAGARSNIDYPLGQLKAEGRIRLAKGGQGYEPIDQNVGYRPILECKT